MFRGTWGRVTVCVAMSIAALVVTASAAAACSNERFRVGASALLPGCRAYEMVSPPDKGGGEVRLDVAMRATPSGDAVLYGSNAAFAGAPSSPPLGYYVSRRGADWTTASVEPPQLQESGMLYAASPAASPDLGLSLQASRLALAPGAIEGGSNLYLHDNLTGERTLVAAQAGDELHRNLVTLGGGPYLDGAADWSKLLLTSTVPMLPEAPPVVTNLYEYEDGELRIVNRLPDGTVSPNGAYVGYFGSTLPSAHAVSDDGSRVFFNTSNFAIASPLYLREDGEVTVPVSESQRPGEEGEMGHAVFGGAAADGSVVYFISDAQLTEDSLTLRPTLYRYEVGSGQLRDLTIVPGLPEGAWVQDVLALSEDGSHVYFSAVGDLTGEAPESPFDANLYHWREGQIEWIGTTTGAATEFAGPYKRLASPGGRYLAFSAFSALTPDDVPSASCPRNPAYGNPPGACEDVYLYDSIADELTCVSCDGAGLGFSALGGAMPRPWGFGDELARAVLDDGTVFFDSPNRLLPADTDAFTDAYAWRHGQLSLLSPGTDEAAASFGEATADGGTVFIRTAEPLLPVDADLGADVYAAREGGGLPTQHPAPASPGCAPGACRGPLPLAADPPAIGSDRLRAGSDLPRRCARLAHRGRAALRAARRLEGERAQRRLATAKRLLGKARSCGRSLR